MYPVVIYCFLLLSFSVVSSVFASERPVAVAEAPLVRAQMLQPANHQFLLTLWAELQPKERTLITPQVAGQIEKLHPAFVVGGVVRKGELLLKLEDSDYRTALINAEAALASARSLYAQEQAQAEVAKRELQHFSKEQLSALALREPQMQSAMASVKSAEALLQKAQRDLARTAIPAPYDALVVRRDVGLGQVVHAGTTLGELYSVEQAELHVPIANFDLNYLPQQRQGIKVNLQLEQRSRDAVVVRDTGIVDGKTRMSHLVVQLDDPYALHAQDAVIRFGEYVQVSLAGRSEQQLFQVPVDLLQKDQLWLLQDDFTLKLQKVTVVRRDGLMAYIRDGLAAGDMLLTTVPNFARAGMKVRLETNTAVAGQP
jgi:RND family efflux transporter MFP subunit